MDKETKEQFKNLTGLIRNGFEKSAKRTDKKIETLARMVKKGFDDVDKGFADIDKRFDENTKQHQQTFERLDRLEQGQDEIKIRLDQVVY